MKFGNLYAIPSRNGLTKPRSVRGDGIKFVNMGELFENERIGNIEMDRVPVSKTEMRDALLQEGDLLFARQSLVREGAGKCSIIAEVEEPTTFDSHLIRVRLNRSIANPSFYRYYFASPLSPMPGIVSQCAQAGIKGSDLKNLDVDCPPLEVQDKIASILGTYDELIENNRRQIKLLEEAAQRLYREWFIDLKFPGHETTPVHDGLPEGWKRLSLRDYLVSHIGGGWGKEFSESSYPVRAAVIRATDIEAIRNGNVKDTPVRWHTESNFQKRKLEAGDIVFEVSGGSKETGVGRSLLITEEVLNMFDGPAICASFCKRMHLAESADSALLYWKIRNDCKTGLIRKYEKSSAGNIINFLWEDFLDGYELLVPSDRIKEQFERTVSLYSKKSGTCCRRISFAREARDRLLPKLMSGEIEV